IFAVHPVLAESVVWVSGRKDLLSLGFAMAALLAWMRAHDRDRVAPYFSAPLVLFAAALLSKSTVFVVPILAWLLRRRRIAQAPLSNEADRWSRRSLAALVGLAVAGVALHLAVAALQGTVGSESLPLSVKAPGMLAVFGRYLAHVVFPVDLAIYYHEPFDGVFDGAAAMGATLLIVLGVFAWRSMRRGRAAGLGMLWFLVALAPFNNLFPQFSGAMADRYLHLPLVGALLALAAFGRRVLPGERGMPLTLAMLGILATAALLARDRTQDFRDSETLWRDAHESAPEAVLPALQLGLALEEQALTLEDPAQVSSRRNRAAQLYQSAVLEAVNRREALQARMKLAPILVQLGDQARALEELRTIESEIADLDPDLGPADRDNLAITRSSALVAEGRHAEALSSLARVRSSSPVDFEARNMRAVIKILQATQRLASVPDETTRRDAIQTYEEGLAEYEALAALRPRNLKIRTEEIKALLGAEWRPDFHILIGKKVHALVEDFPTNGMARYLRARAYHEVDAKLAVADLIVALDREPRLESAYLLLAQLLRGEGHNRQAMGVLDQGLRMVPDSDRLRHEIAATWLSFARHHAASKSPELALEAVRRSLELVPDQTEGLILRGDLHRELSTATGATTEAVSAHWTQARKSYERALELDARNAEAKLGLALTHRAYGYGYMSSVARAKGSDEQVVKFREDTRRLAMDECRAAKNLVPESEHVQALQIILAGYADELRNEARRLRDDLEFEEALAVAERA
ncbi:MAG: hypothetical protein KDB53_04965, partial [Planctomycetes bacterium]|nr:hypothetical protein [Planctomycetota bacterium]